MIPFLKLSVESARQLYDGPRFRRLSELNDPEGITIESEDGFVIASNCSPNELFVQWQSTPADRVWAMKEILKEKRFHESR